MNKTMRKVVAFAATAAMAISLIPSAFASTNSFVMIDNVDENQAVELSARSSSELRTALQSAYGDYDNKTNTFTIKSLPASMPYIRPYDYYSNYGDTLNYAPYMPLDVAVSFYYDGKFINLYNIGNKDGDGIWVDGKKYVLDSVAQPGLTEEIIMEVLLGRGYDTTIGKVGAGSTYGSDGSPLALLGAPATAVAGWKDNAKPEEAYKVHAPGVDAIADALQAAAATDNDARIVKSTVVSALMNTAVVKDMLRGNIDNDDAYRLIENTINKIAQKGYEAFIKYPNLFDDERAQNAAQAMLDYVVDVANTSTNNKGIAAISTIEANSKYEKIHVFHDLRVAPTSHEIKIVYKGVERVRAFQVATALEKPFGVVSAKRVAGINYENMLASASNGQLFIEYSMRDLLATDTWGTPTSAYKLWSRSNFTLAGTWLSFQTSVLAGDTVFFNTNVLLKNADGTTIPAGKELTLSFGKYDPRSVYQESSLQYYNTQKITTKEDGSFDFQLALDKYDMEWLFNGHYQRYVNVRFTDADAKYNGNFDVAFSARNRVTTPVSFAEGERITMKVGETKNINAVLSSSAMSTKINTFVSSTPAVATVAKTGDLTATVTGVKLGTTVITATTASGEAGQIVVDVIADEPVITAKTYKVVTTSSALNVRSGAGTSYGIIGKLSKGSTFQGELNAAGDWVKLNYNGQTGYVSAKYVIAQ